MTNGFDNEAIISRIVEEASTFAGRTQFGQNIFTGERDLENKIFG
jgi:hypothetical protein